MGQQNQTILLQPVTQQHIQAENQKRRKIFQHPYKLKFIPQAEKCILPRCNCPAPRLQPWDLKLCPQCNNPNSAFVRPNERLQYQPAELTTNQSDSKYVPGYTKYVETMVIPKPEPVTYYNAFSLPTQKCLTSYLEPKGRPRQPEPPLDEGPRQKPKPKPEPGPPPRHPSPPPIPQAEYKIDPKNRVQNLFLPFD